jgi:hypothetical protein
MMAGVLPAAREISVPGEAAAWARLGFAVGDDGTFALGGVRMLTGAPELSVTVDGLTTDRPDALALRSVSGKYASRVLTRHANGAEGVDHVVALTDDLGRTLAALEGAGLEVRRRAEPPAVPARMAFLRLGELVLEVVEGDRHGLWGLVAIVPDLDGLGELVGRPRDAVQPGRRIATVRREAGLPVALAFMTPRPQQPPSR